MHIPEKLKYINISDHIQANDNSRPYSLLTDVSLKMDAVANFLQSLISSIQSLQEDARFLAAEAQLSALEEHIQTAITSGALQEGSAELDSVRAAVDSLNAKELRNRCRRIRDAIVESASEIDKHWTLGSQMFGVTTHYQVESDRNVLLRIEAFQENLPFFDLVAVGFEVPLYSSWIPMCHGSELVQRIGPTEFVAKVDFNAPFPFMISREAYLHIFVSECLQEHGKVVALCRSVESGDIPGIDIPPVASSLWHDRVDLKTMKFVFDLSSPSCARVRHCCRS
jgi:hypothetical protein